MLLQIQRSSVRSCSGGLWKQSVLAIQLSAASKINRELEIPVCNYRSLKASLWSISNDDRRKAKRERKYLVFLTVIEIPRMAPSKKWRNDFKYWLPGSYQRYSQSSPSGMGGLGSNAILPYMDQVSKSPGNPVLAPNNRNKWQVPPTLIPQMSTRPSGVHVGCTNWNGEVSNALSFHAFR